METPGLLVAFVGFQFTPEGEVATHDVAFVVVHDRVADVPLGIVIAPPFEAITPFAFPLTVKLRVGEVGGGGLQFFVPQHVPVQPSLKGVPEQ